MFIIFIVVLLYIIHYVKINGEATTISGVLFSFGLYFCVVPIVAVLFADDYDLQDSFRHLYASDGAYMAGYLAMFVFLFTLMLSYRNVSIVRKFIQVDNIRLKRNSKFLSAATLLVGGITFYLYAKTFGGFAQLLILAETMRSFAVDKSNIVSGWAYILVIPARLITVSPFLLLLYKSFVNKQRINVYFILACILSGVFYLANAGKTGILIFGMCFFVPIISYKFKHKWLRTICVAILSLELIQFLDALFIYLGTGEFDIQPTEGTMAYLKQFTYPVNNLLNLNNIASVSGYRFGQDFITGVLNIIPGVNFEPSYTPTSVFYSGPDWKVMGGVPNDIITFGYLQFNYFGVALVAFIVGRICRYVDACMLNLGDSFGTRVFKCSLIILYFSMIVNADVVSIVRNQFPLTILTFCLVNASKKSVLWKSYL